MSLTLTVTAKGQVTLRRQVLEHLGARRGDRLRVDLLPGGRVRLSARASQPIARVFGALAEPDGKPLSVEEIGRVAAEGWAGRG